MSEILVTWDSLLSHARSLASVLNGKYKCSTGEPFLGIVAVARGGLIPAMLIARELDLRVVHTVCVASYMKGLQTSHSTVLVPPPVEVFEADGRGWLIIDDLVDTGRTAEVVRRGLPHAVYATLYAKPNGMSFTDHHVHTFEQDQWVHFPWDMEHKFAKPLRGEG